MGKLNLLVQTNLNAGTMVADFQRPVSAKHANTEAIAQLIQAINSGSVPGVQNQPSIQVDVLDNAVQATGSFTLASVVATNFAQINGVSFTAVASGATGNQFNVGASDTATATNFAAAINASTSSLISGCVSAASVSAVVNLTSKYYGLAGNQTTLSGGQATIKASSSRLTGGANDPGELVYTF